MIIKIMSTCGATVECYMYIAHSKHQIVSDNTYQKANIFILHIAIFSYTVYSRNSALFWASICTSIITQITYLNPTLSYKIIVVKWKCNVVMEPRICRIFICTNFLRTLWILFYWCIHVQCHFIEYTLILTLYNKKYIYILSNKSIHNIILFLSVCRCFLYIQETTHFQASCALPRHSAPYCT